jgi:penicillin-binding protein 2B
MKMTDKKNIKISKRAAIMAYVFIVLFFILFSRILYIQWDKHVQGRALQVLAEDKWTRQLKLSADRGTIFDRNGIELAKDVAAYTVIAILKEGGPVPPVKNIAETAKKLAPILGLSENEIKNRLSREGAYQVEFGPKGRKIGYSLMQEIAKLQLDGISFIKEKRRLYPNNEFASHLIGYTNYNNENKKQRGVMGIEALVDKYLIEKDGTVSFRIDTDGFKLPDPKEMLDAPEDGHSVYLTIDQKIQTFVEHSLNQINDLYEPEKIIAIVADAKSGQILAMSNRPSFDPNIRNITNWTNYAVASRFEPGSTMKVFTLAAAIEEGVYKEEELFQSGSYHVAGGIIRDHNNGKGWGKISFLEGVQRSSNVAFTILAEQIGSAKLMEYYSGFGLTKKTGIDVPGEINSSIRYDYPLEQLSTAWGQGSAITPIQQIQAATAIANQGNMLKPFVIDRIVNETSGKTVLVNKPQIVGNPISENTAKNVLDILETVVTSENGTGRSYRIKGYEIAGKTGTAQIPDPKTGGYLTGWGNNIFSFLGFAPKDDPQLIVYVAVDRPNLKLTETGSMPVSLAFKTIMKSSLQYLDIDPINELGEKSEQGTKNITVNDYTDKHITNVLSHLKEVGLKGITLGNGDKVIAQLPFPHSNVLFGEKVLLRVEGKTKMPNLIGWSLRDVMKLCALMELKPNVIGSGFVVKQNIPPQSVLKQGDYLVVELKYNHDAEEEEIQDINGQ